MGAASIPSPARGRARARRTALVALGAVVAVLAAAVAPGAAGAAPPPAAVGHASGSHLTITPQNMVLGNQRVGTFFVGKSAVITNTGTLPIAMDQILYSGGDQSDFQVGTDCFPNGHPSTLKKGSSCVVRVVFTPRAYGPRKATLSVVDSAAGSPQKMTLSGNGTEGYFLADPRAASPGSGMRSGTATGRTGR